MKLDNTCSCTAEIWADSRSCVDAARGLLLKIVGERRIVAPMISLDWQFGVSGNLHSTSFEEIVQEELHDEAYPVLGGPVHEFIGRYLAADETVLVILGPPGGGKTRLVRANGNQDLHRFLAIADGLVRAQGRKIIFTTNLPNVGDLDEALLRPGRCFAAVHTRSLTPAEAARLVSRLCKDNLERERAAVEAVLPAGTKSCSVASVYRACARV